MQREDVSVINFQDRVVAVLGERKDVATGAVGVGKQLAWGSRVRGWRVFAIAVGISGFR